MEATDFQKEVGRRIRRRRQMLGLSQGEVARRLTMPQSQLSRLEAGGYEHIGIWELRQLVEVLATSADFLLARSDDPGEVPLPGCPAEGHDLQSPSPLPATTLPQGDCSYG